MAINTKDIKTLIELVKENDVHEISITDESGYTVSVRQHPHTQVAPTTVHVPAQAPVPAEAVVSAPANDDVSGHIIRSPMVGTAYLAPSPDAEDFVKVGQSVKAGQTLCLVEAMKMFNKIKADVSGTVKACKVANGEPVEFDQPLFIIE